MYSLWSLLCTSPQLWSKHSLSFDCQEHGFHWWLVMDVLFCVFHVSCCPRDLRVFPLVPACLPLDCPTRQCALVCLCGVCVCTCVCVCSNKSMYIILVCTLVLKSVSHSWFPVPTSVRRNCSWTEGPSGVHSQELVQWSPNSFLHSYKLDRWTTWCTHGIHNYAVTYALNNIVHVV